MESEKELRKKAAAAKVGKAKQQAYLETAKPKKPKK
jgi:hypothetical protein